MTNGDSTSYEKQEGRNLSGQHMILCICQAHELSAGKSNVLTVRLDSGMTSSLLTCEMPRVFWFTLRSWMEELFGKLKHIGMPAELFQHQALDRHPRHAKAKLGTFEEGRLADCGTDLGCHPLFQRLSLADFMNFAQHELLMRAVSLDACWKTRSP